MNLAILLPTIYRKEGLQRSLKSLFETTKNYDLTVVIAREWDDYSAIDTCKLYNGKVIQAVCRQNKMGPAYAWNTALQAAQFFDGYFTASDDIEFIDGWLDEILKIQKATGKGLIGVNDGTGKYERAKFCTHYFLTRNFIRNHNGGVVYCPHYYTDFCDVEIIERANKVDEFAYAPESKIIHHWKEINDEAYRRGESRRNEAKKIYEDRKSKGFPNDYPSIIK